MDKCPKCDGPVRCLSGCSAHPNNWYCADEKGCGWQAWDTKPKEYEMHVMHDVECPYCGAGQEICHDDGHGYEEDKHHEQECHACEKTFTFQTSISFSYEARKADCLNGGHHAWRPVWHVPEYWPHRVACDACGEEIYGEVDQSILPAYYKAGVAR